LPSEPSRMFDIEAHDGSEAETGLQSKKNLVALEMHAICLCGTCPASFFSPQPRHCAGKLRQTCHGRSRHARMSMQRR